jgi:hypothetical protein
MNARAKARTLLEPYLPALAATLEGAKGDTDLLAGMTALEKGSLSWARLNQILHRRSLAGVSEGFFQYYFLRVPDHHPYPVNLVFEAKPFLPPRDADELKSVQQFEWGLRRFVYDAMLYWGNLSQAYIELRSLEYQTIADLFAAKRCDDGRLIRRGAIEAPQAIPHDRRYLISEMACKTYEKAEDVDSATHVQLALEAFRSLRSEKKEVTPAVLKRKTAALAKGQGQENLLELMYEDSSQTLHSEEEVLALYSGQWKAFREAREAALENTRVYLSMCSDLDVYVATSMRTREDFRYMGQVCTEIFSADALQQYNIRYFDPTLSAAQYHEDKGMIECLMVKTAKLLLYFAQHKESLGKVSEFAMALSQGKPVVVLCPDDTKGQELLRFYRESHPLMRLVDLRTGTPNGAIVCSKVRDVVILIDRILSNRMEYDLAQKDDASGYMLLKERLTGSTVRVITDDSLLTETYWNNWHGVY